MQEIDTAAVGRTFSTEERADWNSLNGEYEETEKLIDELLARQERLSGISQDPERTESGDGSALPKFNAPSARAVRGSDIYDMSTLRRDSVEDMCRDLSDRAMRSVEGARFAGGVKREHAQAHIEGLVRKHDNPENAGGVPGEVSRRILTTGSPLYKRAFSKYMAGRGLTSEEQRALSVGTGSAGGFALVYTLDPTIIPTSSLSVNPYREWCRVESIAGTNEWRGVTSAGVTAAYAAEAAAATDNSPTLAQPSVVVAKAHAFVPASIEVTQDWGSIESDLATLIVDAKDDLEATQFTTGTYGAGTSPGGIITGSTNTVTAGGVASFAVADLYKLWESLPPRFRGRASFLSNLFTYNKIRQFDTAGGASLYVDNLREPLVTAAGPDGRGTVGAALLGRPAWEATAMASALTTASKILLVGDGRYFIIVDRVGMDIEVIPHLFGAAQGNLPTGQRGFYAYWRNSSKVIDPAGFRVLVTG